MISSHKRAAFRTAFAGTGACHLLSRHRRHLMAIVATVAALAGCRDAGSTDSTAELDVAQSLVSSPLGASSTTASVAPATSTVGTDVRSPTGATIDDVIAEVETSLRTESGVATLAERMAELSVPGVAVALVRDGLVFGSFASGVTPDGRAMTTTTLTQVGSVSKPVAAVGALRLAAQGSLPWDDDITPSLVSYILPPGAQSAEHPVTLAGLLSHTAGTNVHGFAGYATAADAPTVPGVLAGEGNSVAVRVVTEPGLRFEYSGGGYELVEQAMLDASGASDFDSLMGDLVFEPAGMVDSRYALELPADVAARATAGSTDGEQLPQRWQAHPESAAAGLWTTADDLGRFLAALTASMSGTDESLLPTAWTQRMTTAVKTAGPGMQVGHGLFVLAGGQEFGHGGVNIGYNANIAGTVDGRFAVAVVTNADPGGIILADDVIDTIARTMGWR